MSAKDLIQSFETGVVLNKKQKNVLIVYAHPEPKSFNGALLRTAVESLESSGHYVEVSDLYSMHFEPRTQKSDINGSLQDGDFFKYQLETKAAFENGTIAADIKAEMEKLKRADLVIFQFPLYWSSFPAILKGWFDRVYVMGFAWGVGGWFQEAPMKGKKAMLSFTMGAGEEAFSPTGMNGDINVMLWPMQNGTLLFAGFEILAPQMHFSPAAVSDETRKQWLADWSKRLGGIFEEKPINFVHISNFSPMTLSEEYIKEQNSKQYGPTVGQNMGKPYPPHSMVKP